MVAAPYLFLSELETAIHGALPCLVDTLAGWHGAEDVCSVGWTGWSPPLRYVIANALLDYRGRP